MILLTHFPSGTERSCAMSESTSFIRDMPSIQTPAQPLAKIVSIKVFHSGRVILRVESKTGSAFCLIDFLFRDSNEDNRRRFCCRGGEQLGKLCSDYRITNDNERSGLIIIARRIMQTGSDNFPDIFFRDFLRSKSIPVTCALFNSLKEIHNDPDVILKVIIHFKVFIAIELYHVLF